MSVNVGVAKVVVICTVCVPEPISVMSLLDSVITSAVSSGAAQAGCVAMLSY